MPNMRTVSQDERAKMAREYMLGGMAPYQAARNTGFCRVGLMQEAIRAMEGREAEESVAETPVESADNEDISLPDEVDVLRWDDTPSVAGGQQSCHTDEMEKPKPIYPFLKPGETRKKCLEMVMQTVRIRVQLFEKDGNAMFQITDGERGHYVMLRADRLRELREMIDLCLEAMAIEDRYRVE